MEADFIQCFHPSGSILLLVRVLLDYSRVYEAVGFQSPNQVVED